MPVLGLDPTGQAPVIYVETENHQVIDQKETYIPATIWMDGVIEGAEGLGSQDEPLAAGIRGRGNASWKGFLKKPYKIKFDKKQSLLGMSKSKHWALTHFMGGNGAYFSDPLGRYVSNLVGLSWAPKVDLVELVLNGDYLGMYFLCETIKIAKDRLDIFEQPEGNTDLESVGDGWLVEFDNYNDVNQIYVAEGPQITYEDDLTGVTVTTIDPSRGNIRITAKVPDNMTAEQEAWLQSQWETINLAIYDPDKTSDTWEKYIDKVSVARYFIVSQLLFNVEAWSGSCYWHRDAGAEAKWTAGPVWDIGMGRADDFVYNCAEQKGPYRVSLMDELIKFPSMRRAVMAVWRDFIDPEKDNKTKVFDFIAQWETRLSLLEPRNKEVWPGYYKSSTTKDMQKFTESCISNNFEFLETALGDGTGEGAFSSISEIVASAANETITVAGGEGALAVRFHQAGDIIVHTISGYAVCRRDGAAGDVVTIPLSPGVYVVSSGDNSVKTVIR